MAGRVIEEFELATNPTKLWRALSKPKEARNVVKSCQGYFLLDVRARLLVVSWCVRLAGLCLPSPAGIRKGDSERNEAHRRPYCTRRGRSGVIVLLLLLVALAVTGAEGTQDDHAKMPLPPGGSMRQQLLEQDPPSILRCTHDAINELEISIRTLREGAKRHREEAKKNDEEADKRQEMVKVFRQTLQECCEQDQPEEGVSLGEAQAPGITQKLKLKFNGSLSGTIYPKESLLQYSNGRPLEIAICRGNQIITSGDLSKLEVEIVALKHGRTSKGDGTEEDFDQKIIRSGQGLNRVSVLGEAIVQLDHGKASLGNIHFKEGSGGTTFILAARVVRSINIIGTTRVEEAYLDNYPFVVLSERSKGNRKIGIPQLDDEVDGLKGIKKKGDYVDRLKKAGINTVQKFLKELNEAPENLRRQILNINTEKSKPWRDMVEHARQCDLRNDPRLKSITLQVEKTEVTLFFNVVHDLVGVVFNGCFVAKGEFTEGQKFFVNDLLKNLRYQDLKDTFDHIMEDNRPANIHASINAVGSRSVPISAAENLGGASGIDCADGPLPGTVGHSASEPSRSDHPKEIANEAAENLGGASGIDCADGPLPGTAGQSASEPSRSDHPKEIANQGQNHTPQGDQRDDDARAFSVSDVPVADIVNGTDRVYILDVDPQGENRTPRGGSSGEEYDELLASVKESDKSNPVLDRSSGWNFDLSTNANFFQDQEAAGNSASASGNDRTPGGDANGKSETEKQLARQEQEEQEEEQRLPELYAADQADDNDMDELYSSLPPFDDPIFDV